MPLFSKKETKISNTNYAKGVRAEETAERYLVAQGYDVLQSRYKTKFGEIDLIIKRDNLIAFVEVKVRQDKADALHAVNARTRKRIENSALFFLSEYPEYMSHDMRFDVIAISEPFEITHLDNAWEAGA